MDTSDQPCEGVRVILYPEPGHKPAGSRVTDGQGAFRFTGIPPGSYKFGRVVQRDYKEGTEVRLAGDSPIITLGTREHVSDIVLVAGPPEPSDAYPCLGTIRGRIRNTAGLPLPAAHVGLRRADGDDISEVDSSGNFTIHVFAGIKNRDAYDVSASHPEYMPAQAHDVAIGTKDLEFVLHPQQLITGTVRDARSGEPLPLLCVSGGWKAQSGKSHSPRAPLPEKERLYYHPEGRFEVRAVYSGPVSYWFRAPGYGPACYVVDVPLAHPPEPLLVELAPENVVRGIVVNPGGQPVAEAAVAVGLSPEDVQLNDHGITDNARAWSGSDGRFVLTGLSGEEACVWATHPDYLWKRKNVRLVQGGATEPSGSRCPIPA